MSKMIPVKLDSFLTQYRDEVSIKASETYKLVTISNTGAVRLREERKGSSIKANKAHRIKKGTFIYSRLAVHTGSFGLVPQELDGAIVTNEMPVFEIDDKTILSDYLTYILQQCSFLNMLKRLTRGMGRVRIKEEAFLNLKLMIDESISDQKKTIRDINSRFEGIKKLELEQELQLDYLHKLRQQILQEAIEGKLTVEWRKNNPELISGDNHVSKLLEKIMAEREQLIKNKKIKKQKSLAPITDDEMPFALPDGWLWCRLGDWGITQTGTTPSTLVSSNFGSHIPFIKPADISLKSIDYENEGLSENGLNEGRLICKNSVLMVCIGGSIGKSFFTDRDVSCNQQINSITPLAQVSARLLQQLLQSKYFQVEIWNKAMKSSTPIVNKGKWEEILIPIPPFAEQGIILNRLDELMAMIDELRKQVAERKEQSKMLMQSVLKEAFEG